MEDDNHTESSQLEDWHSVFLPVFELVQDLDECAVSSKSLNFRPEMKEIQLIDPTSVCHRLSKTMRLAMDRGKKDDMNQNLIEVSSSPMTPLV